MVSGNYFTMLGVQPALGRVFSSKEDDQVYLGHPVVVLELRLLGTPIRADPSVIGKKILVNDSPMEIVGVSRERIYRTRSGESPQIRVPMLMKEHGSRLAPGSTWTIAGRDGCRCSPASSQATP